MAQATYPHVNIDVQDNSGGSTNTPQVTPLHMPCFFIFAEKGPIGVPMYGTYSDHQITFGTQTFNETTTFFQHPSVFAKKALQYQPVMLIRVADPNIVAASLVLEAVVTQGPIVQYVLNSLGSPVLNSSGQPTPQLEVDGVTPVTQPGVTIKWVTRALAAGEVYTALNLVTTTVNGSTVTTYPILADLALNAGSATNRSGFSLYYTTNYDANTVAAVNSMTYRFAPVTLAADNSGTTTPVYDAFGALYNDVSFKSVAIDPDTAQDVSFNGILANNYVDATNGNLSLLDYNVNVYSQNVKTIGALILSLSPELSQTMDPFLINILSAVDTNGNPYHHFVIDPASSTVINSMVTIYHSGGTDSVQTKTNLEALTAAFCASPPTAEFEDYFRYPFTHFYDSGYSLQTKYALMNLYSLRDDIKIDFSTQDIANIPNTPAQDQSTGAAILSAVLLYPESTLYGTDAMRASIYQQVGLLTAGSGVSYTGWVPCNIDRMIKRCLYNNADYVKGSPKGRPNSEVTVFKSISWSEATFTQKQLNWDTALNTIGYCDMTTLFYADLRSVYQDQTSLLSDDVFVDYLVYLKHIARLTWTYYAGVETPIKKLFGTISKDIDTRCGYAFNSNLPTTTTVYQTAVDQQRGYQTTVSIAVQGTLPNRIWNVIIPVTRATS